MVLGSVDMDYETNEEFDSRFYRALSGGNKPWPALCFSEGELRSALAS